MVAAGKRAGCALVCVLALAAVAAPAASQVVDRIRPKLRPFRDERGRELLDLPDAPRPDPDVPAPTRFLPEYDNVALSHDDRTRIIAPESFGRLTGFVGTFLVDGFVSGQWRLDRARDVATIVLDPFAPLDDAQRADLVEEAGRLSRWATPEVGRHEIRFGVARAAVGDGGHAGR